MLLLPKWLKLFETFFSFPEKWSLNGNFGFLYTFATLLKVDLMIIIGCCLFFSFLPNLIYFFVNHKGQRSLILTACPERKTRSLMITMVFFFTACFYSFFPSVSGSGNDKCLVILMPKFFFSINLSVINQQTHVQE